MKLPWGVRDRLPSLHALAGNFVPPDLIMRDDDESAPSVTHQQKHPDLEWVLQKSSKLESLLKGIKSGMTMVEAVQEKFLRTDDIKADGGDNLSKVIEEVKKLLSQCQKELGHLHDFSLRLKDDSHSDPTILRLSFNAHYCFTDLLMSEVSKLRNLEFEYREQCARRMTRQMKLTADVDLTYNQASQLLKSSNDLDDITKHYGGSHSPSTTTRRRVSLAEMQNVVNNTHLRQQQLAKFEDTVREMRSLFTEAAVLIHMQGAGLNRVERNVQETVECLGTGYEEVKEALVEQRTASYNKRILIGVVAAVILVAIFFLILRLLSFF